jgi:hypothetical protein
MHLLLNLSGVLDGHMLSVAMIYLLQNLSVVLDGHTSSLVTMLGLISRRKSKICAVNWLKLRIKKLNFKS